MAQLKIESNIVKFDLSCEKNVNFLEVKWSRKEYV